MDKFILKVDIINKYVIPYFISIVNIYKQLNKALKKKKDLYLLY